MARRAYFGDLLLQRELRRIVPTIERGTFQVHQGVDRVRALVDGSSAGFTMTLSVRCFWGPESDYSKEGFRARDLKTANALVSRSLAAHPLVYVKDDALAKVVDSYAAPTITSAGHGFANSSIVLIRREGAYTLGTVSSATTNTFVVSAQHTIQAGDDILPVEMYWAGCWFVGLTPLEGEAAGDYYQEQVTYTFRTDGTLTYSVQDPDLDA